MGMSTAPDFMGITLSRARFLGEVGCRKRGSCHPHKKVPSLGLLVPRNSPAVPFFSCPACFRPRRQCWLACWLRVTPTFSAAGLHLRAVPHPTPGKESSQGELSSSMETLPSPPPLPLALHFSAFTSSPASFPSQADTNQGPQH